MGKPEPWKDRRCRARHKPAACCCRPVAQSPRCVRVTVNVLCDGGHGYGEPGRAIDHADLQTSGQNELRWNSTKDVRPVRASSVESQVLRLTCSARSAQATSGVMYSAGTAAAILRTPADLRLVNLGGRPLATSPRLYCEGLWPRVFRQRLPATRRCATRARLSPSAPIAAAAIGGDDEQDKKRGGCCNAWVTLLGIG